MGMDTHPETIGRYTVLSVIGRGAMGVVYHARDPLIGRELAIKTITLSEHLPPAEREEFKQRFFREAQAAGALRHPNIVTIYDMGEQDGVPFIAMEYLEGASLAQRLKDGPPIGTSEAAGVARQVAEGLSYAHGQGIIHRDIKPDNILLSGGRAVIADFGVAHMNASNLTRTGEILGTPFYMCPEQVLGGPPDGRSDLFSLGVVFYQMLVGKRPFRGESISAVCYQIVHGAPEPPSPESPLPPAFVPVLDKMLAKKPDERYQDADAFIAALDAASGKTRATGGGQPTVLLGPPTPRAAPASASFAATRPSKPAKKSRASIWALAIAGTLLATAAIAGGIAVLLYLSRQPTVSTPQPQKPAAASSQAAAPQGAPNPAPASPSPAASTPQKKPETHTESRKRKKPVKKQASSRPRKPPPPRPVPATIGLTMVSSLKEGRLVASVDGRTVLDKPFRNTRAFVPWMTWREDFRIPPGRHDVHIEVKGLYRLPFRKDGRRRIVPFHAEERRTVTVESGKTYRFKVEPKLFPHDHLVIEKQD